MRPERTAEADPALKQALSEWRVGAALPPRFNDRVWQRIASHEAQSSLWSEVWTRLGAALLRPAMAVSYLTVLLAGGLFAGYWHARVDNARTSRQLETRYVQTVASYETLSP